jgi:formate dehydrogenase iron-sulfur subunit
MEHERVNRSFFTWPASVLLLVMMAGAVAVVFRLMHGLGASTNLSDVWPWGLWKGFNVLCLITLGAGGFTSAALVYIFGGEKYHGFARPAALWGLLCYCFAGASLAIDIGIPWRIVNPIYMWSEQSILFEVAWCVMLYISILALEVAPTVFERFGWDSLESVWRKAVPLFAVAALSFFTYIMAHSIAWAAVSFAVFSILSIFLARVRKKPSMPVLLIMFGVIISTLHQSSLGSLFLLMPDKLSHFWWSPRLPFNFFLSAIMTGFCVLIIERTISARVFKRPFPDDQLMGLAGILAACLWIYTAFRMTDVLVSVIYAEQFGGISAAFRAADKGALFFVEVFGGLLVPAIMLSRTRGRESSGIRLAAASIIVLGVMFNRLNVTFLGMTMPGVYVPSMIEFSMSAATMAAILFLFTIGVKLMPVYPMVTRTDEG